MNLENMTKIYARGDSRIQLKVIPGHFVTSQSHITHYLDLTTMKSRTAEAQNIALLCPKQSRAFCITEALSEVSQPYSAE